MAPGLVLVSSGCRRRRAGCVTAASAAPAGGWMRGGAPGVPSPLRRSGSPQRRGQCSHKSHGWGPSWVQPPGEARGHISRTPRTAWADQLHICLSFADPEGFIPISPAGIIPFPALPTCKVSPSRNSVLWIKVRELKETMPRRLQRALSLGTGEGFPSMNHLTVFYFI